MLHYFFYNINVQIKRRDIIKNIERVRNYDLVQVVVLISTTTLTKS